MNLKFIKLHPDSKNRKCFERINNEAFPAPERMSFDEIFDFASGTNTDVLGIYDDETPVGFVVFLKNTECGYLYYIAIDVGVRSKGYGSAVLQKMMDEYPKLQIILDFEELDESAENNKQRIRRKNFYLRNGFHETGNYTLLWDNRFEVVCIGGELRKTAFKDLLCIIHEHRAEFPDVLL